MKRNRHDKILEIIREKDIETQEELAAALKDCGYTVTQATVSRDIRQLGLSKSPSPSGKLRYVLIRKEENQPSDKYARVLKDSFVSAENAQNLLVIRTVSGMAMAAAAALDAMDHSRIVGCIAGDDTIFAAMRSTEDAAAMAEDLRNQLQ
ncbi:MAG: arginine repressor [Lachnospiraceae bacterium]|nr:arginine repressor [Lachnospiraceae bacterium]